MEHKEQRREIGLGGRIKDSHIVHQIFTVKPLKSTVYTLGTSRSFHFRFTAQAYRGNMRKIVPPDSTCS